MTEMAERLHTRYERLLAAAQARPPLKTAVAHPCDDVSLSSTLEAARLGLIAPILVGPQAKLRAPASAANLDLEPYTIVDSEHSVDSAMKAVALVREGKAQPARMIAEHMMSVLKVSPQPG